MLVETRDTEVRDTTRPGRGPDRRTELEHLRRLVLARRPGARTVLEVVAGPAGRAGSDESDGDAGRAQLAGDAGRTQLAGDAGLAPYFDDVLALPLDAATRPADRRVDVVACLDGVLAGEPLAAMRAAVAALARRLAPGGLLLIEPFWLPTVATHRAGDGELVHVPGGQTVAVISHGRPYDGAHRLERHTVVAGPDGIRHTREARLLHHFGRLEYLGALAAAGCGGDFLADRPGGRPLVVGVRR